MQVIVQQQVVMIVMVVVMIAVVQVVRGRILLLLLMEQGLLLLLIAAGCCGRLLAVVAAVAVVVLEWWQGDTRTRAQRSIEPHCAPLLGGHPALRLFYTAQVQALLIFLVTTTIEATHASTLAHQGLEMRRRRWKSPFSSGVRVRTSTTAVNLPLLLLPLLPLFVLLLLLFVLLCCCCTTLVLKSHQIQLLPRLLLQFCVLLLALVYFILHCSTTFFSLVAIKSQSLDDDYTPVTPTTFRFRWRFCTTFHCKYDTL